MINKISLRPYTASVLLSVLLLSGLGEGSIRAQESSTLNAASLTDTDPFKRVQALYDISKKADDPKTATTLVEFILREDNLYVRATAVDLLASIRTLAGDVSPRMIILLRDPSADVDRRARAAQVLGAIAGEAPGSIGPLVGEVENVKQAPAIRQAAAEALLNFGRMPADVVPRLKRVAFTDAESPQLREAAIRALANTGRDAISAVTDLTLLLGSHKSNLDLREQAAYSLGTISSDAQTGQGVTVLTQVLGNSNENTDLRVYAAKALEAMGPRASDSLPVLSRVAFEDKEASELRLAVLGAMMRVGQDTRRSAEGLAKLALIPSVDLRIRVKAVQVLGSVRPGPAEAMEMAKLAYDVREPPNLRRAAVATLRADDPTISAEAPTLKSILIELKQDAGVQSQAAQLLAQLKPVSADTVRVFVAIIGDPSRSPELRGGVAYAAGMVGPEAAEAVPILVQLLRDSEDLTLRRQACWALMAIRHNSDGLVPELAALIVGHDTDLELRRNAVLALGAIGSADQAIDSQIVPILLRVVTSGQDDPQLRQNAAAYLGQLDVGGTEAIPALAKIVEDPREDPQVRSSAASQLGGIGRNRDISQVLPKLLNIVEDDQEQRGLRQAILGALAQLRPMQEVVISAFVKIMRGSPDSQIKVAAINAIGVAGQGSKDAAAALSAELDDSDQGTNTRAAAAQALGQTGEAAKPYVRSLLHALDDQEISPSALQGFVYYADKVAIDGDITSLPVLRQAEGVAAKKRTLASMGGRGGETYVAQLRQDITILETRSSQQKGYRLVNLEGAIARHPYVLALAVPLMWLAWLSLCGILLLVAPFRLLWISNAASKASGEVQGWGLRIPLGWVILPSRLRFHSKSLDAWVRVNIAKVRRTFNELPTVQERSVYVDLPVMINGSTHSHFGPETLTAAFKEPRTLICITGEGGAGKTSAACQIGNWALMSPGLEHLADYPIIPILIEGDIPLPGTDGSDGFQETIREHLRRLLNEDEPISKPMLDSLLKRKRMFVIVDGYSEMGSDSQAKIQPMDPSFPSRALVITTRNSYPSSAGNRTTVMPSALAKSVLSVFMHAYLKSRGKLDSFSGQEFQDQVASLQRLVKDGEVTPLFARLYIDLMISAKESGHPGSLPGTIPELILQYLNHINDKIASEKKDNNEVHRVAKVLARACVRPKFHASPARIDDVLSANGGTQIAREDLNYFEERLGLIRTVGLGEEVRFQFDPLAEYLAALSFVDENRQDEASWKEFLEAFDRSGEVSIARGLLEAVSACYIWKYPTSSQDGFIVRGIRTRLKPDHAA